MRRRRLRLSVSLVSGGGAGRGGGGVLLHFVGSVRFVLLDERQRMSLRVEDPVVEG